MTVDDFLALLMTVLGFLFLGAIYAACNALRLALGLTWEGFGVLCLTGVVITPFSIFLINEFIKEPKETAVSCLLMIWLPHYAVAWAILKLVRHPVFRSAALQQNRKRIALIFWLRYLPCGFSVIWALGILWGLMNYFRFVWWIDVLIAIGSGGLWMYLYYLIYFKDQPKRGDWGVFTTEFRLWQYDRELDKIRSRVKGRI